MPRRHDSDQFDDDTDGNSPVWRSRLITWGLAAAALGLGFMIQQGRRLARPDVIIVGMLTIGLLGALMSWILTRIEARFASSRRLS